MLQPTKLFKELIAVCIILFFLFSSSGCGSKVNITDSEQRVLITTSLGTIKIKLYNDTPLHRDNFIRLVEDKFYDGVLFHRVIKDFMIQSGDPDSKSAGPGATLGNGGPGYQIPAEFAPQLFHKKGALAAARMGDQVNPEKESSGSQFYIVQGKVHSDTDLIQIEQRINNMIKQSTFFKFLDEERERAGANGDSLDLSKLQEAASLRTEEVFINTQAYKIPPEQLEIYKTLGGVPHLDQNSTAFGEVIEGLDVVDAIAATATNNQDRPLEDVRILKMTLVRK